MLCMSYLIVGLGNPGDEYIGTRHNTGRMVVEAFRKEYDFPDWKPDQSVKAMVSKGVLGKERVVLLLPDKFMNASGKSVAPLVKTAKDTERTIVVYDDLALPLGSLKVSFDRSSGGHRGLQSVITALKTAAFPRLRVGVCPVTGTGKLKKFVGDHAIVDFIIAPFKKNEVEIIKKTTKQAVRALALMIEEGREAATGAINTRQ